MSQGKSSRLHLWLEDRRYDKPVQQRKRKSSSPALGIDIDGVLADSYRSWLPLLNQQFGTSHSEVTDLHFEKLFPVAADSIETYFYTHFEALFALPPPVPHARRSLAVLRHFSRLILLTTRRQIEAPVTYAWLKKWRIPYDAILFTEGQPKGPIASKFAVVAAIDDDPEQIVSLNTSGIATLLFDAPYNRCFSNPEILRVRDWHQASTLFALRQLPPAISRHRRWYMIPTKKRTE